MKRTGLLLTLFLCQFTLMAQYPSTPELYSWVRNLTGAVGYGNIPSNVLSFNYDASNVYVAADCIPGYSIGPWNSNPNTPANQNFVYKITRHPTPNTGTLTAVSNGHTGVWSNGVSVFDASDAMSYNNAGVWNRNAYYWEGISFDSCLGHPAPNGEYHNHVNPICLYDETDSLRHSPIIGYAFDGYPIYGTYGYANANGTGPIKRIKSSYVVSTTTTRTNGPAVSAQYPAGCFMEDWIYTAGAGDLDVHNGHFCVTPEYPQGTYCYVATLDAGLTPTFPYTMYKTYYGVVQTGNTGPSGGHNVAPGADTTYSLAYTPTITITPGANPICSGSSVTFTAASTNGGPNPSYVWEINGAVVGHDSTYTSSALTSNDTVTCMLTSNAYYLTSSVAISNRVIISTGAQVAPSISINASPNNVCSGTVVTFSASPVNGGTSPSYQWQVNGINVGTDSNKYAYPASSGDTVTCVLTSSLSCASPTTATSNKFAPAVIDSVTPAITITVNTGDTICGGDTVSFFVATTSNLGTNPVFTWSNGSSTQQLGGDTFTSAILGQGNAISCGVTSNAQCATSSSARSNVIRLYVKESPLISLSSNSPVCVGEVLRLNADILWDTTFSWVGPNGFVSNADSASIQNVSTINSGTYHLSAANTNGCLANSLLSIVVDTMPVMPVISLTGNVLTSSASANNQWYELYEGNDIPIFGATASQYGAPHSGWYKDEVTNGVCSVFSDSIYYTVPTGLKNLSIADKVKVLPNPFNSQFNITISNSVINLADYRYTITDCLGRVVFENNLTYNNIINMTQQASGFYLLNIYNGNEKAVYKLIKQE